MLLAIHENKMHEVLNAIILSLYRPNTNFNFTIRSKSHLDHHERRTWKVGVVF